MDAVALRIRDLARESGVEVIEDPPLARALFATVEVDQAIPRQHFEAVATIIGFILGKKTGDEPAPRPHVQANPPEGDKVMTDSRAAKTGRGMHGVEGASERRGFDAVGAAASALFVIAVLAAAYPAFRAGPTAGPGLLLLLGLAGVAFIGCSPSAPRRARAERRPVVGHLLDALDEPSGGAANDGSDLRRQRAWDAAFGRLARMPRTAEAAGCTRP
jgi:hypothetical protein